MVSSIIVSTFVFAAVIALSPEGGVQSSSLPEVMGWEEWRETFESERTFGSTEREDVRRVVYERNIEAIVRQNALNDAGLSGHRFGVNQFTDMTAEEFKRAVGLDKPLKQGPRLRQEEQPTQQEIDSMPSSIDWRTHGAVTPVKNQGQCGSCWSFGTTGAIEGAVFVGSNKLVSLSESQLVDCSTQNDGCSGGLIDWAMEYVVRNGGLDSESDYPYHAVDGRCDHTKEKRIAASISGYKDVPRGSVTGLMSALAQVPVAVAIEADQQTFQMYRSGVITSGCGTSTDHAVLAVGYTETNDPSHPNAFIVKNSWGPTWGANGYVYISRSQRYSSDGVCGILAYPTYAVGGTVGPNPGPSPPGPHPTPTPPPSPRPPSSDAYGNPFQGGCNSGESKVTINRGDVGNAYCGVDCTNDYTCPDAPSGFNYVSPQCLVKEDDVYYGHTFCGLRCGPSSTCANGGTCSRYCTQGSSYTCYYICAYDPYSVDSGDELVAPN